MTLVLRGITWEHPRGYDCMVASAARYQRVAPDVEVQWDFRSLQAFADAPLEKLAAEYDLLVIDHPHIPFASSKGLLAPLDGVGFDDDLQTLSRQSVGRSHASYSYDGHQYGLASDAAAQVSVYRGDLLTDPPSDWPGVMELAREGRVLWPAKPIDAFSSMITLAAGNGTPPAAEAGVFLPEAELLPVLEELHQLAALVPDVNLQQNPIEVAEMLAGEDRWLYAPLSFGYTNYSRRGFRHARLSYTDIPERSEGVRGSLLGGAGIAVSARTENVDAARAFAFWVASAKVQSGVYYDAGGQPGNALAWQDDRINSDSLDFFRATRATLDGAYVRPRYPGYVEFQDLGSAWVGQALRRDVDDRILAKRLNDAAAELLTGE